MTIPYNTGKVKIGHAYTPPVRRLLSRDEERIQELFIGSGVRSEPSFRLSGSAVLYSLAAIVLVSTLALLMET